MIPIHITELTKTRRGRFPVAPKEHRTIDGVTFASKKEAAHYATLKLRERIGEIHSLELQPKFEVQIKGRHFCTYTPDFRYFDCRLGETVIIEVKSSGSEKDAAYRLRRKAAEFFHGVKVTEVVA